MTKTELQEYYWTQKNIKQFEDKIEELTAAALRTTTQFRDDPIHAKGSNGDRVGNIVAEIAGVREELQLRLEKAYVLTRRIEQAVDSLPARESYLIRARYLELRSWEQIAEDMNYSWQWLHKMHTKALKLLA